MYGSYYKDLWTDWDMSVSFMLEKQNLWKKSDAHVSILKDCEACALGKMATKPFSPSDFRIANPLDVMHTDVCRVFSPSLGGSRYFVTFMDDYSRYIHVRFLQHKDEEFEAFRSYKAHAEKQTGRKIKAVRSDNGGEYISWEFQRYLDTERIVHQWTCPHTPQMNGRAERLNYRLGQNENGRWKI